MSDPVVTPGDTVDVFGDSRLSGSVVLTVGGTERASAPFMGGVATIGIPEDVEPGSHALHLIDPEYGDAFGALRVSDGPGLWIHAPTWIGSGESPRVTVTTFDVPAGMTVALELTGDGQIPEILVPHAFGGLAPIAFGRNPGDGLPRGQSEWRIPGGFTGSVRVVADRAENMDQFRDSELQFAITSSTVRVRRCDEPSEIVGDLGTPGSVRAVWLGGALDAEGVDTDDGRFAIPVRPGPLLVTATRGAGFTAASPQVVRVRCGDVLDVGSLDEPVYTGPSPGTYLHGITLEEAFAFSANAAGDVAFEHEGIADCSAVGDEIELSFTSSSFEDLLFYYVTIPDFAGSGRYDADFSIIDVLSDTESMGVAAVEVELGRIDDFDAIGGSFTATFDGALGSGTVEGRFTCVFFAELEIAEPLPGDPATVQGAVEVSYRRAGGSGGQEECRKALVAGQGDYPGVDWFAQRYAREIFTERLPRVSSITMTEVRGLFDLSAQQQLLGTPEEDQVDIHEVAGAIAADYLVVIGVTEFGDSLILAVQAMDMESARVVFRESYRSATEEGLLSLPVGADVAGALQETGICGEVDRDTLQVAAGEEQPVTYRITDLAGEAAEGAIDAISSTCGTFQPQSGAASNGEFETTFTGETGGCTEQVTFVARTETPIGEVTTERDAATSTTAIAIPMFQYRYTLDYSSGSGSIHAESEGLFFVEPDFQQVIGAGTGTVQAEDPAAPCVIIDTSGFTERPQQFDSDGSYRVLVSGDLSSGSVVDGGTVRLLPGGFGLSLVASWSDPDCFPPGTQTNEVFAYLISAIFVTNPSLLAGLFPDGFEIPFTTDGQPTTKSFPLVEADGSGSVTLEIWLPQSEAG